MTLLMLLMEVMPDDDVEFCRSPPRISSVEVKFKTDGETYNFFWEKDFDLSPGVDYEVVSRGGRCLLELERIRTCGPRDRGQLAGRQLSALDNAAAAPRGD